MCVIFSRYALQHLATFLRQGFDHLKDSVFEDLGSEMGLLKALSLVLRLSPLGLLFGGVPCESFGFMASPTHQRSALDPWGAPFPFVYLGNVLCTRFCILALISMIRGCVWALENPLRTCIDTMPPIQLLLHRQLRPLLVKWFFTQIWQHSHDHKPEFSMHLEYQSPHLSYIFNGLNPP